MTITMTKTTTNNDDSKSNNNDINNKLRDFTIINKTKLFYLDFFLQETNRI